MSGTSMDGVDLALIESDGKEVINRIKSDYIAYQKDFKERLRKIIYQNSSPTEIKKFENELTEIHINLVNNFLKKNNLTSEEIDLISFHGHTIAHNPDLKITWQISNSHLLAIKTRINVISDFRSKDIALNGQGAPLVPIYHFYMTKNFAKPIAVLNIGGISNITYINDEDENNLTAFDVCFGNAPLDELMKKYFDKDYDDQGKMAKTGKVDFKIADQLLQNDLIYKKPPKSFDRNDFDLMLKEVYDLKNPSDILATLVYMHAKAIEINLNFLPAKPKKIIICGGGRKNLAIIEAIKDVMSDIEIKLAEEVGFDGDSTEAEAFAFLGIRSLLKLPISFQKTTGVLPENNFSQALSQKHFSSCGGVFYPA